MYSESFEEIVGIDPDSPEFEQSASEETKAALLGVVHEKVRPPSVNGSWVMRSLRRPNHEDEIITVTRYSERATRRLKGAIAQIAIRELFGPDNDNKHRTSYTISESPDGLQMRRSTSTPLISRHSLGPVAELSGVVASASIDMDALRARHEAEQTENELGLNTVYETEAVELLAMVQEAQPFGQ